MQEEEERYVQIINDSNRKLVVLKLLSNFFNHKDFVGVLVRTKVIHSLFQKNKTLDINKLELFHIQFTNSLIELFQKIKKSKEQQYLLVSDEMDINADIIAKMKLEIGDEKFSDRTKGHAQLMSKKIEQLYHSFESGNTSFFDWHDIMSFSDRVKSEYYREISIEEYDLLTNVKKNLYENKYAKFEKKLLGRLNILNFKIKFLCGLECNNEIIEVYEFRDSNDRFIFVGNEKSFYFIDEEKAKGINLSKNNSAKAEIIAQLEEKNALSAIEMSTIKTSLPENVQDVLRDYLHKISSVDFLEDLQNVDEQTNILRTMLNININ
ncbi:hypothetical protein [Flavobacterium sp. 245]|uniref:hypothetical protein n=1 Tax=Flavobacterium sp. 245 TaxID=2512115 RepID=UPI001060512F|nr:hypothetical protein [Flavobacterium sp. 245]TDO96612.1 hypothetical protein EV145_111112 [Flavobacterium sp. 245]